MFDSWQMARSIAHSHVECFAYTGNPDKVPHHSTACNELTAEIEAAITTAYVHGKEEGHG